MPGGATDYQVLHDGRSQGAQATAASTDKFAFWGATPVDQPANVAKVATSTITTAATTTTPWGFATSTQADAIAAQVVLLRTAVNSIITNLEETGQQATA